MAVNELLPGHGRYGFTPITARPAYRWPGETGLAVYVALNVECFAWDGHGPSLTPDGDPPNAQHRRYSWRDYGNRVGFWRLIEEFAAHELPATFLLNAFVIDMYPQIAAAIKDSGGEVVGHGRTNSEPQGGMDAAQERELIAESTTLLTDYFGQRPYGWMSPSGCQSPQTLDLLAEAGYRYSLDWPIDDQPVWLRTDNGPLLNVPYAYEVNDYPMELSRKHTAHQWEQIATDHFDEMLAQSRREPLVFSLSLHTFLAGAPHRLRVLRRLLDHIVRHRDRIWFTTPGRIADHVAPILPVPAAGESGARG